MKNTPIKEMTLEELEQQKKKIKSVIIALAIVWAFAIGVLIYLAVKKNSFTMAATMTPLSLLTCLPILISLNNVQKEINSRKQI